MVVVDNNGVTVAEANILADFFSCQADKHGPQLLQRLTHIGEESGQPGSRATEQRKHKIQIEVEAENVIRHEVKLEQGQAGPGRPVTHHTMLHSPDDPGTQHSGHALSFLLNKNEMESKQPQPQVQYLMSQDGKIFPLLPETLLRSLPLLQGGASSQGVINKDRTSRGGGVSVIQRAPAKPVDNGGGGCSAKIELNNPNIILERRVHLETGEAGASHRRQIDTSSGVSGAHTASLSLGESRKHRQHTSAEMPVCDFITIGIIRVSHFKSVSNADDEHFLNESVSLHFTFDCRFVNMYFTMLLVFV